MRTSFILVTELAPHHADWHRALAQAERLDGIAQAPLGIAPRVRLASLPPGPRHGRTASTPRRATISPAFWLKRPRPRARSSSSPPCSTSAWASGLGSPRSSPACAWNTTGRLSPTTTSPSTTGLSFRPIGAALPGARGLEAAARAIRAPGCRERRWGQQRPGAELSVDAAHLRAARFCT